MPPRRRVAELGLEGALTCLSGTERQIITVWQRRAARIRHTTAEEYRSTAAQQHTLQNFSFQNCSQQHLVLFHVLLLEWLLEINYWFFHDTDLLMQVGLTERSSALTAMECCLQGQLTHQQAQAAFLLNEDVKTASLHLFVN